MVNDLLVLGWLSKAVEAFGRPVTLDEFREFSGRAFKFPGYAELRNKLWKLEDEGFVESYTNLKDGLNYYSARGGDLDG